MNMATAEKSLSRQIAEFANSLEYKDLPEPVIHEVKRYLYDSIGCAYGGYHTKDVGILRDIYKEMAGREESTLIGFGDKILTLAKVRGGADALKNSSHHNGGIETAV